MNDRELLELAAKAAGIQLRFLSTGAGPVPFSDGPRVGEWNPLTDDGDALRLAVKLGISVLMFPACIEAGWPHRGLPTRLIGTDPVQEDTSAGQDVNVCTRRAIVRAAAEIGKALPLNAEITGLSG